MVENQPANTSRLKLSGGWDLLVYVPEEGQLTVELVTPDSERGQTWECEDPQMGCFVQYLSFLLNLNGRAQATPGAKARVAEWLRGGMGECE